jgi:D-sedoheptulose 7-phosphate isomerase
MSDGNPFDQSVTECLALHDWFVNEERAERTIQRFSEILVECFRREGRVLTCGNGGSMCEAMHFAEELSGRYRKDRRALAAQSISDPSHLTCVGNDYGFESVFSRGVEAWGCPGDVLVAFSTTGKSPNVVAAAKTARARKMTVVGLLGQSGGDMKALCDLALIVPGSTSDRIQEIHMRAVHFTIELVERELFPANYAAGSSR